MSRVAFSKAGFDQGTTWGTEVAVGATDQILPTSIDVGRASYEFLEDTSLAGTAYPNPGTMGARMTEATLTLPFRYGHNLPRLLAFVFGTSGAPSGGPTYTHTLTLADRLTKFLSLVWTSVASSTVTIYNSVVSGMVEEVTLRGVGGAPVEMTVRIVGCSLIRDGAVNGSTQVAALTLPDSIRRVLHTDGRFRLNAQGGAALGSGDVLKPSGFTLTIRRPLSRDHLMDSTLAGLLSQPVETGLIEVRLELEFPGLGAVSSFAADPDEFMDAFEGASEKKADILFTLDATNTILLQFPRLQVVEDPTRTLPNAGRLPHRVVLRGIEATAAPTGMTGITKPISGTITDGLSGAYLA